jgi:DNA-binding NarL/FixJ family response regulator
MTSLTLPYQLSQEKGGKRKLSPEREIEMNCILLADPNPTLRSALALLLETRLDAQVVGQVSSMESLLCEAAATNPDTIIIGLDLSTESIRERISVLRQKAPRANILIASTNPNPSDLGDETIAFICKSDPPETILNTIQSLSQGKSQKGVKPA